MDTGRISLFDRVAVSFGATLVGGAAALAVTFMVWFWMIDCGNCSYEELQFSQYSVLLLWTVPTRFALVSGVVGFFSPRIVTFAVGKVWDVARGLWRQ